MINLGKRLPALVIILVTAMAFAAGNIQNSYAIQADNMRQQADIHQLNVQRIDDSKRFFSSLDITYLNNYFSYLTKASADGFSYLYFYDNLTNTQREQYKLDLLESINSAFGQLELISTYSINETFGLYPNLQVYQLASVQKQGFDYNITRAEYDQYPNFRNETKNDFFLKDVPLLDYINSFPADRVNGLINFYDSARSYSYFNFDSDNYKTLMNLPLYSEQHQEQVYSNLESQLSFKANLVTIGVSVTTIATLLATAMASRLADNWSERRLEAVSKDKNVTDKFDIIAAGGLIIAFIVAIVGLLGPMILIFLS